jgi:hypothetical protein
MIAAAGAIAVHGLERRWTAAPSCRSTSPASRCRYIRCSNMLDGLARPYNAVGIALLPPFVLRPLMLIAAMAVALAFGIPANATTAMAAFAFATWTTTLVQLVLFNRCLARNTGRAQDATTSAPGSGRRARSSRSGPSIC